MSRGKLALAAVSPNDAPQRRVCFERRGINADRLAFDQAGRTQALQHPSKHSTMRFEIDQSTRPRNPRMVWWRSFQSDGEKSRNANESAARHAMPRSESMPSK